MNYTHPPSFPCTTLHFTGFNAEETGYMEISILAVYICTVGHKDYNDDCIQGHLLTVLMLYLPYAFRCAVILFPVPPVFIKLF